MNMPNFFNIRVYGILVNSRGELLLSDETYKGQEFTKFPGGGLCFGEGPEQGLHREFKEEANLKIEIRRIVHVTANFIPSAFDDSQVIGIYYQVDALHEPDLGFREVPSDPTQKQVYRWVPRREMSERVLTFEIDQAAWRAFKSLDIADR